MTSYHPAMSKRERDVLERAVGTISEQAAKADALVDEAIAAGLSGSDQLTLHAKMLRQELLQVKADLERELGRLVLDCADCGRLVHWVAGLGVQTGHLGSLGAGTPRRPSPLTLRIGLAGGTLDFPGQNASGGPNRSGSGRSLTVLRTTSADSRAAHAAHIPDRSHEQSGSPDCEASSGTRLPRGTADRHG